MMKIATVTLSAMALLLFSGCIDIEDDEDQANVSLKIEKNFPQSFTITLQTPGDTYAGYELECEGSYCPSGETLLQYGANYKGTVQTVCSLYAISGNDVDQYSCVTTYDTQAPFGDQDPQTRLVSLAKGSFYELDSRVGTFDLEENTVDSFTYNY